MSLLVAVAVDVAVDIAAAITTVIHMFFVGYAVEHSEKKTKPQLSLTDAHISCLLPTRQSLEAARGVGQGGPKPGRREGT